MDAHIVAWIAGAPAAIATASVATRAQLLPDVIDISSIPTGSGVLSLALVSYGALRRFDPDRMARLSLLGTLLGGLITSAVLLIALIAGVIS